MRGRIDTSLLEQGRYPSWDADNEISAHLACSLGYEQDREYKYTEYSRATRKMRIIDGKRNGRGKKGKQNQDEMKNEKREIKREIKTEIEEEKREKKLKKRKSKKFKIVVDNLKRIGVKITFVA